MAVEARLRGIAHRTRREMPLTTAHPTSRKDTIFKPANRPEALLHAGEKPAEQWCIGGFREHAKARLRTSMLFYATVPD
jgi:hypothetical protein